jgi:hypothetical protein
MPDQHTPRGETMDCSPSPTPLRIYKAENGLFSFVAEVVRFPGLPIKSEFLRILLRRILNGMGGHLFS